MEEGSPKAFDGGALNPLSRVEDLARLCARLATSVDTRERILADAGVDAAVLEAARVRWSHPILSDRTTADRFTVSYSDECRALVATPTLVRRRVERPSRGPAVTSSRRQS